VRRNSKRITVKRQFDLEANPGFERNGKKCAERPQYYNFIGRWHLFPRFFVDNWCNAAALLYFSRSVGDFPWLLAGP